MKIGERIPELNFKMKNHSEERLKNLKFHRVSEAPELFYFKFPVVKSTSGKMLLLGKIIVSSINGECKCFLYGQNGELYAAFFNHNHNTDSYIYKINKLYIEQIEKIGVKEIENKDRKENRKKT